MRYHIHGIFKEERRKGFAVTHQMEKNTEYFSEIQEIINRFLDSYDKEFCYGLALGISEEPSLVE